MRLILVLSVLFFIIGCEPQVNQETPTTVPNTISNSENQQATDTFTTVNLEHVLPPAPPALAPEETQRALQKNWNLVSLPIEYPVEPEAFIEKNPAIQSIWAWDLPSNTWKTYPQIDSLDLIQFLDPNQGYWLKMNYAAEVANVENPTPTYYLHQGWNLVGYGHGLPTVPADEFFEAIGKSDACHEENLIINAWIWSDGSWQVYFPDPNALTELNQTYQTQFGAIDTIEPGTGIWINTSDQIFPPSLDYDGTYQISLNSNGIPHGLGTVKVDSGKLSGNLLTEESINIDGCLGPNGTFTVNETTQNKQKLTLTGILRDVGLVEGRYQLGKQNGTVIGTLLNRDLLQARDNFQNSLSPSTTHFDKNYDAVLKKGQTPFAEFSFTVTNQQITPVNIQVDNVNYTLDGEMTPDGRLRFGNSLSENDPAIFLIEGGIDPDHFTLQGRFRLGSISGEFTSPNYLREESSSTNLKISEASEIQPLFFDDGQSFTDIPPMEYILEETHYAGNEDSDPPHVTDLVGANTSDQGLRTNLSARDGNANDSEELEVPETIPDYVTDEVPNGVDSNTYSLIDTFDEVSLGSFQYTPKTIGLTSRSGWKHVNHEGEGALRNEMTESPQTYYWKLSNTYDLSLATQAKLQIRYQFKKHLYDYFHILVGEIDGEMQLLQEITVATEDKQDLEFDLNDYLGQKIRVEFVLKKPNNVIERRIGLYVFQAGVVVASPTKPEPPQTPLVTQQTRDTARSFSIFPKMIEPRNPILPHSQPTFRWHNGVAKRVYLTVYTAKRRLYHNQVYPTRGRETTPQETILLPFDEGAIRVKFTYQMPNGRWGNRYYFYYLRSGQLTWPINRSTLSYEKTLFTWTRGYAKKMYLNVYTRQGRVFFKKVDGYSMELEVPTDQGRVYVNLWTLMGNRWQSRRYSFNPPPPKLINPHVEYFFKDIEVAVNLASSPFVYFQVFYGNQRITTQFLKRGTRIVSLPGQENELKIRLWYPNARGWWNSKDYFIKPGTYLPPAIGVSSQQRNSKPPPAWDQWGPTVPPNFFEVWESWKKQDSALQPRQGRAQSSRIEMNGDHWVRTLEEGWHMVLLPVEAYQTGTTLSHRTLDQWFTSVTEKAQVYSFFIWDAYLEQWAYYSRESVEESNVFHWEAGFPSKQKSLPIWVRVVGGPVQYEVGKAGDSPSFTFVNSSEKAIPFGWSMVAYNNHYQREVTPRSFIANVMSDCAAQMGADSLWQWKDNQWRIFYFGRFPSAGLSLYSQYPQIETIHNGEGLWVRYTKRGTCQINASPEMELPPDTVVPMADLVTQGLKESLASQMTAPMPDTGLTLGEFLNIQRTIPSLEGQLEVYQGLNSSDNLRIGGLISAGDGNSFSFRSDIQPAGLHGGDIFLTRAAGSTPWGHYSHSGMWMRNPPVSDRPIVHSTPQSDPPIPGAELDGVQYAPTLYFQRYSRLVQVYHTKVRDYFYNANPNRKSPDEVAIEYYGTPYGAYFNKNRKDKISCSSLVWRAYKDAYIDEFPNGADLYPYSIYILPDHIALMTYEREELKLGQISD